MSAESDPSRFLASPDDPEESSADLARHKESATKGAESDARRAIERCKSIDEIADVLVALDALRLGERYEGYLADVFARHDKPVAPVLDNAARQGLAGRILDEIEPETEADPVAILVTVLTAFGNAIAAGGPYVAIGGAVHHARIYALLVGNSSKARKGQSWADTRPLFKMADPDWLRDRLTSGLTSGEGLISLVRDPRADDEGKVVVEGVTDKRLLAVEPEFGRLLGNARREGSSLSAVLRAAWDDGDLRNPTRNNPERATGAGVSLLAHITAEELQARLTSVDIANGFANRILMPHVERSKRLPGGGRLDSLEIAGLGVDLKNALDAARRVGRVVHTDEAWARWRVLYEEMAEDTPRGLVGALSARAEAHVLRLSLTYALLDGSPVIDLDHVEAAWALWSYCRSSVSFIFGDSTGDVVADRLLRGIRRAGADGLSGRDQHGLFSRNIKATRLDLARAELEDRGLIRTRKIATGGRDKVVSFDARLGVEL